jgi:hypothetical protein
MSIFIRSKINGLGTKLKNCVENPYERLTVNSAAMIQVSMIRLLLKRLA